MIATIHDRGILTMSNYSASHIANFFLEKAKEEDMPITQMKLMKLVYIGYGWVYALLGRKLFEDSIQAWKHGPVIRTLYDEFKHYGNCSIEDFAVEFDYEEGVTTKPQVDESDSDVKLVLEKVWGVYKHFSASALRKKTHEAGTPWQKVYDSHAMSTEINDDDIEEHFTNKITEYLDVQ